MDKYNYGRHIIPVELIQKPEERYRAREAKQENVDALETSLVQFGSINEHVEVVMFIGMGKALPPKAGFKPPVTAEELINRNVEGYFTVVGDHTQRAMNQLHRKFGKNPKWATLTVTVYVAPRSPEVYNSLKSWGILDNIKGEKRVTVSFYDKITALHQDFLSLEAHAGLPGHKERTASLKEQRRQDFGGISSGQIMQLWSLAGRSGEVWDLLLKIITGDVTAPSTGKPEKRGVRERKAKVKQVNSAANFTNIGGIEDAALIPLLTDVVNGHSSLQRLSDCCSLLKSRRKVQTVVLQDGSVNLHDWDAAKLKFPLACHDQFIERWAVALVREGVKVRASLPDTFFTELERRISSDLSTAVARSSCLVCFCPLILIDS
jgi:hypothetical protein